MSDVIEPSWDEWLATLDATTRPRAESLRDTFARLAADEPEAWARSEIDENIAQLGRFIFLRAVWNEIERWRDREAVSRFCEGASDEAIEVAARVAARAAFDVAAGIVQLIDDEQDLESSDQWPGWLLIECSAEGKPTGRVLGGLHESLLETDPRGIEAEDIRDR